MENINKLSIKKTTDLFFFIICIIFIVLCSQLLLSLLKPIFYGENIRSFNLLFLSVFTVILYKLLDIFAIKIKISKKILRYLLVFIFLLTIIKLTSDSKSLEILIDVIILDFGAIYIISEIVKSIIGYIVYLIAYIKSDKRISEFFVCIINTINNFTFRNSCITR